MKKLIGIIWVVLGVGLFLYSVTEMVVGRELVTHALAGVFGVFSAMAGVFSLRRNLISRPMLLCASAGLGLYSIFALVLVGWEFGNGFISSIILILALAVLTLLKFARKGNDGR